MIRAILFDLDGTLLDNDIQVFLGPYFRALTRKLSGLIPPEALTRQILASTQVMMRSANPDKTNQQVFMEDFFSKVGRAPEELVPLFAEFYEKDFPALKRYTRVRPEARPLVQDCFERGYDVVIATNPVFPLAAVQHRLDWAEVGDFPYALVTTYENMHFCKPHLGYYLEIAEKIGRAPSECIMVGNDPDIDMVAGDAGMLTFYVDYDEDPHAWNVRADYHGTLEDFRRLVVSWPAPGKPKGT